MTCCPCGVGRVWGLGASPKGPRTKPPPPKPRTRCDGPRFTRSLSSDEIKLGLLRSGLHPHPGPPGDIDDPEWDGNLDDEAESEYLRQVLAEQRLNIEQQVDSIQAVAVNHAAELSGATSEHENLEEAATTRELGEELRQLIATNRAAAIARKMKLTAATAAAALEASRARCQQCIHDPIAEATAAREAAKQVMEQRRECNCRGCKESVLGIDGTCIAPAVLTKPIVTSINELWNTPW